MSKGSDNPYPSILLVEQGSAPASPSSGNQRLYIKTSDHLPYVVNSSGTVTAVGGGGGSASLLAVHAYRNGSNAALATITATSATDIDATNAAVTFTAPASGNVLVRCQVPVQSGTANFNFYVDLREGSSTLATNFIQFHTSSEFYMTPSVSFYLTGVTAGSHTYKLAGHVNSGGSMPVRTGPTDGQLIMEVWAAP